MECGREFDRILASLADRKATKGSAYEQHIDRVYDMCAKCSDRCETARVLFDELDEQSFKSLLLFLMHTRDGEFRLIKQGDKVETIQIPTSKSILQ